MVATQNQELIASTARLLKNHGYAVTILVRHCFDIVAQKDDQKVMVKVLTNANAFSNKYVHELQHICHYMKAAPLIVAGHAGAPLEEGVVYSRLGLFVVSLDTLRNSLKQQAPLVLSTNAGLSISINKDKLRELREEKGLSLQQLAMKLGVSRRMIAKYEQSASEVTLHRASRLFQVFGNDVFHPIDLFDGHHNYRKDYVKDMTSPLTSKYFQLGFHAFHTNHSPFDIIARNEEHVIFTGVGDKHKPRLHELSQELGVNSLFIFNRKRPSVPEEVPLLSRTEFMRFHQYGELMDFLREF